jgi:DNA-binding SARP family transcriptional activator
MDRAALLAAVASGERPLRDLLAVDDQALVKIEAAAIAAFVARRFDQSAQLFAGLLALEPQRPEHALHLGHAYAEAGAHGPAIDALSHYLEAKRPPVPDETVRALLTRARLYAQRGDQERARADRIAAENAAGKDPALLGLVKDSRDASGAP